MDLTRSGYVVNGLLDALRGNAMLVVVHLLDLPAPVCLVDGALHGVGHLVGVHDDAALNVPRRPADGLDQSGGRTQEALLVSVQYGDQAHFREVKALTQQVDPHHNVVNPEAQVAQDFAALQGVDLGVEVVGLDTDLSQVVGELLGHPFGQGSHQTAFSLFGPEVDLVEKVVYLSGGGLDLDGRVDKPGGSDDLLDDLLARARTHRGRA